MKKASQSSTSTSPAMATIQIASPASTTLASGSGQTNTSSIAKNASWISPCASLHSGREFHTNAATSALKPISAIVALLKEQKQPNDLALIAHLEMESAKQEDHERRCRMFNNHIPPEERLYLANKWRGTFDPHQPRQPKASREALIF